MTTTPDEDLVVPTVTVDVRPPEAVEIIPVRVQDDEESSGYVELQARRPKDSTLAHALGVFSDKYAPDGVLARTAFDFMQACLTGESWAYILRRLKDTDDGFDTEHLTSLFEVLVEEFRKRAPAPANRAEARARRRG